jgi:hypothetical protein
VFEALDTSWSTVRTALAVVCLGVAVAFALMLCCGR